MKVVAALHPSFIQRGNWPSLALLRNDLETALKEAWYPEVRRKVVDYVPYPTVEQAREVLRLGDPRPFYLDIETDMATGRVLCCGVARAPYKVVCCPWKPPFTSMIAAVLQDPGCRKIAQNIPFDFPKLESVLGISIAGEWFDTMQAHAILEPDLRHGLAFLGLDYYDGMPWKEDGEDTLEVYNCKDVDVMARADEELCNGLRNLGLDKLFRGTTMRVVPLLIKAREWGVGIDLERQAEIREELEGKREEALSNAHDSTGRMVVLQQRAEGMRKEADALEAEAEANWVPGKKRAMGKLKTKARHLRKDVVKVLRPNIGSTKQLKQLLYKDLKMPVQRKKNDSGNWVVTTDETALVELARRTQHPIVDAILRYREAQSHMTHVRYEDPVVHPTWQPHGTGTGRLSCIEPNVQNIPKRDEIAKRIRGIFKPVNPDWMLTAVDYSQIERRLQAVMSGDPTLVQAFADGVDVHKQTAAIGLSMQLKEEVKLEDVTPQQRYLFKRAVYLESYGGGFMKLQTELAKDGVYLSPAQAKELLVLLKASHPVYHAWREALLKEVQRNHCLRNVFGRVRWFLGPAFGDALNFLPQSTAADVVLRAMLEIDDRLPHDRAIIVAQIHDEILVEHDPAIAEWVKATMVKVMEQPVPELDGWSCPTEAKQGSSWAFD
jgi:DNA polymerase-1